MDAWAWIAAYVVGFALLQVLLFRYLRGDARGTDAMPRGPAEGGGPPAATTDVSGEDARACSNCGAVNAREPGFRFCRQCCQPLG